MQIDYLSAIEEGNYVIAAGQRLAGRRRPSDR